MITCLKCGFKYEPYTDNRRRQDLCPDCRQEFFEERAWLITCRRCDHKFEQPVLGRQRLFCEPCSEERKKERAKARAKSGAQPRKRPLGDGIRKELERRIDRDIKWLDRKG